MLMVMLMRMLCLRDEELQFKAVFVQPGPFPRSPRTSRRRLPEKKSTEAPFGLAQCVHGAIAWDAAGFMFQFELTFALALKFAFQLEFEFRSRPFTRFSGSLYICLYLINLPPDRFYKICKLKNIICNYP